MAPDSDTPISVPSIPRRMACWMYEGLLMFGVVFLAGYLFSALSQTRNGMDNRNALQGFLFVIFGIYFVWFWAKGQTLAMKTWHIRVVDMFGQPITQKRALLRYALSWIWFLPPLVFTWAFGASAKEGIKQRLVKRLHAQVAAFLHDLLDLRDLALEDQV